MISNVEKTDQNDLSIEHGEKENKNDTDLKKIIFISQIKKYLCNC